MIGSDKDGFSRNAVHVNADTSFEIVEVDESVFRDKEDDAITRRNLHCDGEVISGFDGEEDVDSLLLEYRISRIVINLNNVQLTLADL